MQAVENYAAIENADTPGKYLRKSCPLDVPITPYGAREIAGSAGAPTLNNTVRTIGPLRLVPESKITELMWVDYLCPVGLENIS